MTDSAAYGKGVLPSGIRYRFVNDINGVTTHKLFSARRS